MNLFDYEKSKIARDTGKQLAADNSTLLEKARQIAVEVALMRSDRRCSADDVGVEMQKQGLPVSLGPAAGSLFRQKHWRFTGDRINSKRVSNHAREIKVWELIQ
tara:strand:- start:3945 stop:4256 length:312 start_codon:yes stop_codon:yes gene_type:complete